MTAVQGRKVVGRDGFGTLYRVQKRLIDSVAPAFATVQEIQEPDLHEIKK